MKDFISSIKLQKNKQLKKKIRTKNKKIGNLINIALDDSTSFKIIKWKVKSETKISKVSLMGLYELVKDEEDVSSRGQEFKAQTMKLKADNTHVGTIMDVVVKEK